MAFVKITGKTRTNNASNKITVGCYLGEGGVKSDASTRHLTFRFPIAIVRESGIPHPDHKMIIFIHEGTGEDAGFLMIMHDPLHGYRASQNKSSSNNPENTGFSVNIPLHKFNYYTANECPVPAEEVDHICQDGGILIQCPDWLRANIDKMREEGSMPPIMEYYEPPPRSGKTLAQQQIEKDEEEEALRQAARLRKHAPSSKLGKHNVVEVAADALEMLPEARKDDPNAFALNRSERRVLAKKVATTLGKR